MKSIKLLLKEIKIEFDKNNVVFKLPMLLDKIKEIFLKIKSCEDEQMANKFFDSLEPIHSVICELIFTKHLELPKELWIFFKDFDRIDDYELRTYIFNLIKNEEYSLNKSIRE